MIGIIFNQDIRFCPYLERYASILKKKGFEYECIWWERWEDEQKAPLPPYVCDASDKHIFSLPSNMNRLPFMKIADFAAFGRFAEKIIKERNYEKLIILTTMTGILLSKILLGKYRKKFIFDIRDYSYEKLLPYKLLEAKIIDASFFTSASSEGFREFLPKNREYIFTHNFLYNDIQAAKQNKFIKKKKGEQLILSYVGFVRYFGECGKVLDKFLDDDRFILKYHGLGADYEKLLRYKREHDNINLEVTGYYDNLKDKGQLCSNADIINNFYPHTLEIQRLATTNKNYDSIIYKRPQLVSAHTFSQELVNKWAIGCALDIDSSEFADKLYDYYHSLDENKFEENAEKAQACFLEEDRLFSEKITVFLSSKGDKK